MPFNEAKMIDEEDTIGLLIEVTSDTHNKLEDEINKRVDSVYNLERRSDDSFNELKESIVKLTEKNSLIQGRLDLMERRLIDILGERLIPDIPSTITTGKRK
jgi:hypothetical protein